MKTLAKLLRIKQWAKNAFVLAAVIFTGEFRNTDALIATAFAFLAFSLVSSATYIFNDIVDVERDRLHPKKKDRPIAAGSVSVQAAAIIAVLIGLAGIAITFRLGMAAVIIIATYLFSQVAYNLKLKSVAVADVFTIAFGFVLRAAMGAAAIQVPMSGWLFVCTGFLALMLGFAKRRNEFILQGAERAATRSSLQAYNQVFLDAMVSVTAGLATMGYGIYTIQSKTADAYPGVILTLPFVMYGICRYLLLVFKKNSGGEPADILFGDKHIALAILGFVLAAIIAITKAVPIGNFITQ